MKKFFPIFLIIFLFWCENVYAETGPYEFKINNYQFINTNQTLSFSGSSSYSFSVNINTLNTFQYWVIYFSAGVQPSVSKSGGCTSSCFGENYYIKLIGNIRGTPYYALVMPQGKWDCGVGSGQCLMSNTFTLSSSGSFAFFILGVDWMNNDSVINSDYASFQNIVNSQNTNAQNIINSQNTNAQNIINGEYTNSQNIINNSNQNTQSIISSNNNNTQSIIDSNKVCTYYDKNSIVTDNYYLNALNQELFSDQYGITDYLSISKSSLNFVNSYTSTTNASFCFYNINKSLISCTNIQNISGNVTIPSNSSFLRVSIRKNLNLPTFEICKNGNSAISDTLNDSDTSQAQSTGNTFFDNFHVDSTRGFSSIITAPIRLIQGILGGSSSCTPLSMTIGMKQSSASTTQSTEVSLPCGSILWNNVPSTAVLAYWSTIFGLFSWFVLRDMYKFIDGIRDPDDKTEFVMSL